MTETTRSTDAWLPCHCCGRRYPAVNVVNFFDHPGDVVCVTCATWLYNRSRPIARRLNPIWRLPAFVRTRLQRAQ